MTKDAAAENRQAWEKGDLKDCLELVRSAIAATIFYSKDADLKKSLQKTVNSINISLEAYGASLQPKEAEPTGEVELQAREKESAFLNEKINEKEAELQQARQEIENWRESNNVNYERWKEEMYKNRELKEQLKDREVERMSEIGIWLQNQLRFFTSIEGEITKVSDYAGGLSIKFKNGNGYTLKLSKQCQVSADEFPREDTTTRRG
jgi:hypothetical protein